MMINNNKDNKKCSGTHELETNKRSARNRFSSSLRAVKESSNSGSKMCDTKLSNSTNTWSIGVSCGTGSSELLWEQETSKGMSKKEEKKGRTTNVFSTSKQMAGMEKINALTSNRIHYATLEGTLYGCDEEIALLNSYLDAITPAASTTAEAKQLGQQQKMGPCRSLIQVKGPSGIGKTALVSTLKNPVMKRHNGLYVQGKFDLFLRDAVLWNFDGLRGNLP
jgi:hypothetical protein